MKHIWLKAAPANLLSSIDEWLKIEAAYADSGRHYHTLQHLSDVYDELAAYYNGDVPASSLLALFYHDVVYNTLRGDNEKQSADWATDVLSSWTVDPLVRKKASDIIIATAKHESDDVETMVFLDADMAILGAEASVYQEYTRKVRKEYNIYPDLLYNPGRRKFVESTLKRDKIFLTAVFQKKYEDKARVNLSEELKVLR